MNKSKGNHGKNRRSEEVNKKRKERARMKRARYGMGGKTGRTLRVDGRNGHPGGLPSNTPTKTQQLLAGRGKKDEEMRGR